MAALRKNIKFHASEEVDVISETMGYFSQSGFNFIQRRGNKLKFGRGSIFSNMWTFNPLKWKSEIEVEFNGQEVAADFQINTVGQISSWKEEELWQTFIDNYRRSLTEKDFDFTSVNANTLSAVRRSSLKYIGWAALGGLIGGILAGVIAYLTGIDSIVSIGAACGAMTIMAFKIDAEKRKRQGK